MVHLASCWKTEACGQSMLPDRSVLIGQKLVENAKIQIFKYFEWFSNNVNLWDNVWVPLYQLFLLSNGTTQQQINKHLPQEPNWQQGKESLYGALSCTACGALHLVLPRYSWWFWSWTWWCCSIMFHFIATNVAHVSALAVIGRLSLVCCAAVVVPPEEAV